MRPVPPDGSPCESAVEGMFGQGDASAVGRAQPAHEPMAGKAVELHLDAGLWLDVLPMDGRDD